jgi:hypothetical protein
MMHGSTRALLAFSFAICPAVAAAEGEPAAPEKAASESPAEAAPTPEPAAPAAASAAPAANPKLVLDKGAVEVKAGFTIARGTSIFDKDGNVRTFGEAIAGMTGDPNATANAHLFSMVFDLSARYGIMDGLEVGAHVPVLENSLTGSGTAGGGNFNVDNSKTGLSDVSVNAAYEARLPAVNVGGGLFVKLPTGKSKGLAMDEYALGSGQTDIGLGARASKALGPVELELALGYIIRLEGEYDTMAGTTKLKPGNVLHADVGVTYWFSPKVAARLDVQYYTTSNTEVAGTEAPDSASNAFTAMPAVIVRVQPKMVVTLAGGYARVGTSGGTQTFTGSGPSILSTGYALFGQNDLARGIGFTLTAAKEF